MFRAAGLWAAEGPGGFCILPSVAPIMCEAAVSQRKGQSSGSNPGLQAITACMECVARCLIGVPSLTSHLRCIRRMLG